MSTPSTAVAIAIVCANGHFLIGRRGEGRVLAGYWEFPGGKVESNEPQDVAAVRECLEETGLEVEVVRPIATQRFDYEHGRVELSFFLCRPLANAPAPHPPYCWVARERLAEFRFPPANAGVLQRIIDDHVAFP